MVCSPGALPLGPVSTATDAERPARAVAAPECDRTAFDPRLVRLKERLTSVVGEAVECPRINLDTGDLEQRTTTGLATLRAATGLAAFSAGGEHWAMIARRRGLLAGREQGPASERAAPRGGRAAAAGIAVGGAGFCRPAAANSRAQVAHTGGSGVVLRSAPRDGERTPRGFMDGTAVTVVQRDGSDWALVRGDNGQEGWIPTQYLAVP